MAVKLEAHTGKYGWSLSTANGLGKAVSFRRGNKVELDLLLPNNSGLPCRSRTHSMWSSTVSGPLSVPQCFGSALELHHKIGAKIWQKRAIFIFVYHWSLREKWCWTATDYRARNVQMEHLQEVWLMNSQWIGQHFLDLAPAGTSAVYGYSHNVLCRMMLVVSHAWFSLSNFTSLEISIWELRKSNTCFSWIKSISMYFRTFQVLWFWTGQQKLNEERCLQ